jgi:hypothetical protein
MKQSFFSFRMVIEVEPSAFSTTLVENHSPPQILQAESSALVDREQVPCSSTVNKNLLEPPISEADSCAAMEVEQAAPNAAKEENYSAPPNSEAAQSSTDANKCFLMPPTPTIGE